MRGAARGSEGVGEGVPHPEGARGGGGDVPGIDSGPEAVDDTEDLVLLRVPDQAVGGLTVLLAEQALAVDDRGGTSRECEGRCRKVALALFGRVERRGTGEGRHKFL